MTRSQVLHAAAALPRPLQRRADPRPRPGQARDDRMPTLRQLFEFAGVDPGFPRPSQVRAGSSLDLAEEARDPARHASTEDEPLAGLGRRVPRRAWLALDVALPALEADQPAGGRRRGARPRGARGPSRGC